MVDDYFMRSTSTAGNCRHEADFTPTTVYIQNTPASLLTFANVRAKNAQSSNYYVADIDVHLGKICPSLVMMTSTALVENSDNN